MTAPHMILDCLPSFCQQFLELVGIWRIYDKTISLFIYTRCNSSSCTDLKG